ncbi:MAG: hypothetical protein JXA68_09280, partial [Ignavibacteriales bacterium]|nr:hypothetical protein [Ignavibacteriales bacterium]
IFIVSGFWHGANWTFIIWGLLNAIYFFPLLMSKRNRNHLGDIAPDKLFPSIKDLIQITLTFILSCLAWIFFRAENITHALSYIKNIFINSTLHPGQFLVYIKWSFLLIFMLFIIIEWTNRNRKHALDFENNHLSRPFRWGLYYFLVTAILLWGGEQQTFIYFQF